MAFTLLLPLRLPHNTAASSLPSRLGLGFRVLRGKTVDPNPGAQYLPKVSKRVWRRHSALLTYSIEATRRG